MLFAVGEESLTIFVDKRKLSRKSETAGSASVIGGSGNSSAVSLETLHQLAASYFISMAVLEALKSKIQLFVC